MFTGIIEELGTVDGVEHLDDAARITVRGPLVVTDAGLGDSIAVNGCCLTVAEKDLDTFTADVMLQTLKHTALGDLVAGSVVNLERAVTPSTRLGGHLVQGHVDAVGSVVSRTPQEHWTLVEVEVPTHLDRYLVDQGSITIDGVSLTVVEALPGRVTVSLIPETLKRTTLGVREPGSQVNLEVDVVAKYVEKMVAPHLQPQQTQQEQS